MNQKQVIGKFEFVSQKMLLSRKGCNTGLFYLLGIHRIGRTWGLVMQELELEVDQVDAKRLEALFFITTPVHKRFIYFSC